MEGNFRHFNAAAVIDAARGYEAFLNSGGKMLITLAGAMSTAELGITLAEMIRRNKVHIISATGANLEEDLFNLVANTRYKRIPNYRDLTPSDEWGFLRRGFNRVTDTCIPEKEAIRRIGKYIVKLWKEADRHGERRFPHEFCYELIRSGALKKHYEIDPKNSWLIAASEKNLPIVVPGWEDSTLGNIFASCCIAEGVSAGVVKSGVEYMMRLADWYTKNSRKGIGFFQIGGGIAGDFPICVVPMLRQDLKKTSTPFWAYFCQISDSTTSYGGYSGAVPNEKISWGKLHKLTPKFVIESDATIVAPLIFGWVLGR
jgi:deoxyhypusine synthase